MIASWVVRYRVDRRRARRQGKIRVEEGRGSGIWICFCNGRREWGGDGGNVFENLGERGGERKYGQNFDS
jgi:hypothetical protein